MATFQRYSGEHRSGHVRTFDEAEIAKYRRLVEDRIDGWQEVEEDAKPKRSRAQKKTAEPSPLTEDEAAKARENAIDLGTADTPADPEVVRAALAKLADGGK